jgi:hypothetical protein
MADINVFGALYEKALEASVSDALYGQVSLRLTVGNDTTYFYVSMADIENLFGTLNNYIESKVNA